MEKYLSISALSDLSGVTTRTIRFYDQIGLLKPASISSKGYRFYNQENINTLEQILYFKNLGFSLDKIKVIINDADYDVVESLTRQQQLVEKEIAAKRVVVESLKQAIKSYKGEISMENASKFRIFKEGQQYEQEANNLYGQRQISAVKENINQMTDTKAKDISQLEDDIFKKLDEIKSQELGVDDALSKEVFNEHRAFLQALNPNYSKQYHAQLAQLYKTDERFMAYYDDNTKTHAGNVLVKIIQAYTK